MAYWIWREEAAEQNETARFRKSFRLTEKPEKASVTVSAHHYFKMWVNGTQVGGLVSPAASVFQKHKLTLTYEIGHLLQEGENVLAFTVLWLDGGAQNRTRGCAGLYFEMQAELGGCTVSVCSDESCRCSGVTEYIPHLPMRERRELTGSTRVDLSRIEKDWNRPGFDDSGWEKAVISPAEYLAGKLIPQEIPEGAVNAVWTPELIHTEEDFRLYDAGEVLTGYVRVKFKAEKGELLRLRYAELRQGERKTYETRNAAVDPLPRVEHGAVNDVTEYYMDEYIAQGGEEVWAEDFSYRAFRYIELTGKADVISLKVCKTGTDAPCAGSFRCGEDIPDRLAEACIRTQKNAIQGILVDCPHREQAQYIADSLMQTHQLVYNFPHAAALMRKVLRDFADNQYTEGYFTWNAPMDVNLDGKQLLRMPEYDLMYPTLLRDLWFYSGDAESVKEFYPAAARMTAYYLAQRDKTGLMPKPSGPVMHISDWPYSEIDEKSKYLFMYNGYLIRCLGSMAELAKILGRKGDAAYWTAEADRNRKAMFLHFYDKETGFFRDTPESDKHNTAVQVMALRANLFPVTELGRILHWLPKAPFETKVIMSWDYLSLLFSFGFRQQAYEMITDPAVRWGRMMKEGFRIIWEGFEDIESHSHAWNAYPIRLMQEHLLGVKCTSAGFRTAAVEPFFPEGIRTLEGEVWTPQGVLAVKAEKRGDGCAFRINVPEGMVVSFSYDGCSRKLAPGKQEFTV